MKSRRYILLIAFILTVLSLGIANCEKVDQDAIPDMLIEIEPASGKTTTYFNISLTNPTSSKQDKDLYFRWDWDGDSLWDTPFSNAASVQHRFYQAGNYPVRVQVAMGKGPTRQFKLNMDVEQGYSMPKVFFTALPDTGNRFTQFYFDASDTYDDEDSIEQLQFRWDFGNDGYFDTPFNSDPVISHQFMGVRNYEVRLQVKDPSNKIATASRWITVNKIDPGIIADFSWESELGRVGDPFIFDASPSFHIDNSTQSFNYSWKFSYLAWTEPSEDPFAEHIFSKVGGNVVELKVSSLNHDLFNTVRKVIFVGEENRPPEPHIRISIPHGNIHTQFYFNTWGSKDDHVGASELLYGWDFDGDGYWDTQFSNDMEVHHQYILAGEYSVILEAADPGGEKNRVSEKILVSPYSNETSFFVDGRDLQIYGTVKIGNQWWMAENLNYFVPQKLTTGLYTWLCLFEQDHWCKEVGRMYHVSAITENRNDYEFLTVCPPGWHLPDENEFEELFSSIGGDDQVKELALGGAFDFNAKYLGYADYYFIMENMFTVKDTVYRFKESFKSFYYPSSSIPYDINDIRTGIWMMGVTKESGELWKGYRSPRMYVPVRCVKD